MPATLAAAAPVFSPADTIVAIATPPGHGGIGVVRLSGPDAHSIAARLAGRSSPFEPRRATLVKIMEGATGAAAIDQSVVTLFARPHSYTGDDVVEIAGHGSPVLLEAIVARAVSAGARLAQPGEFTFRAYLNGRIDLVQAEAVADLVHAATPLQARAAMDQLDGTLTGAIGRAHAKLFDLIARCEASLDFPEEGFRFIEPDEMKGALDAVGSELRTLLATAGKGRLLREGRHVVLAGRPNTGKSSLFNALLGRSRAIVTPVAGTTRDLLSEPIDVDGVPVTLVDTAGMRETDDPIERAGVERAADAQQAAALTVVVLDRSRPPTDDDRTLLARTADRPRVVVLNKCDLADAWPSNGSPTNAIEISAVTGAGLDRLRRALVDDVLAGDPLRDTPAVTNIRHIALLEAGVAAVERALSLLAAGGTEELLLAELHDARERLEEVTGRRTADQILQHIFATFCVGK